MKKVIEFCKRYPVLTWTLSMGTLAAILSLLGFETEANYSIISACTVALIPIFKGMYDTLREGKVGLDILAATSIIVGLVMQEYWASLVVTLMLTGGESLEDYAENRAQKELKSLLNRAPRYAYKDIDGKLAKVKVREVKVGDLLIIRPGDTVPVDSIIIDGQSNFDESSLTGESLPQLKSHNQEIYSGTINEDSVVKVKALRVSADSQYEKIVKLVKYATSTEAPFVKLTDRLALPFTALAYIIAVGAWLISGDSLRFLQVLVVATPCPLLLAGPIAMISGMSQAARKGIIIKSSKTIEQLAKVKSIAFDKTGTLTFGQLEITGVDIVNPKYSENEILSYAGAVESYSSHIIANAITESAKKRAIKIHSASNISESTGNGASGLVNKKTVLVGKISWLANESIKNIESLPKQSESETAIGVSVDGQLIAQIRLKDKIRSETKTTLENLEKLGVEKIMMLTGDKYKVAKEVADRLNIKELHADLKPEDKINFLKKLPDNQRPVVAVGDGLNDAPLLAVADVGIAMGARGDTATSEAADIVIMLDDISKAAKSVEISKRTMQIAWQSIAIGLGISTGLMLLFSTGRFSPTLGAALQEFVDIAVIVNALRAHRSK